jgi:two-component system chemotaxis response regulator CheB
MKDRIFVVGASHGGIEALSKLVAQLPADFPAPVFIVQHPGKRSSACACSIHRLRATRKRLPR